jgi:hypothetical protein
MRLRDRLRDRVRRSFEFVPRTRGAVRRVGERVVELVVEVPGFSGFARVTGVRPVSQRVPEAVASQLGGGPVVVVAARDAARDLRRRGIVVRPRSFEDLNVERARASTVLVPRLPTTTPLLAVFEHAHRILQRGGRLVIGLPGEEADARWCEQRSGALVRLAQRMGFALAADFAAPSGWFVFVRGDPPKLRLRELSTRDERAALELFRACFGYRMPRALWRWKYADGRGLAIGGFQGGRLVANYSATLRRVLLRDRETIACQPGDTMVLPEARGGRGGPFPATATTYMDLTFAWYRTAEFGYGFAGHRALRAGKALGLYAQVSEVDTVRWPPAFGDGPLPRVTRVNRRNAAVWTGRIEELWRMQRADLVEAVVQVRDYAYVEFRYLRHPTRRYEVLLVEGASPALVVLQEDGDRLELVDFVGPRRSIPAVVRVARHTAAVRGSREVHCLVTSPNTPLFVATGGVAAAHEAGISIEQKPQPRPVRPEDVANRWWLMSGDSDHR